MQEEDPMLWRDEAGLILADLSIADNKIFGG
jgi:hypothetical protein